MDIGAELIREWHLARGWKDIGYHRVIKRNGIIENGRDFETVGAHVAGYNSDSIGICLVGGIDKNGTPEDNFTPEQHTALMAEIIRIRKLYPDIMICGHRDLDPNKACPSFDVREWLNKVGL